MICSITCFSMGRLVRDRAESAQRTQFASQCSFLAPGSWLGMAWGLSFPAHGQNIGQVAKGKGNGYARIRCLSKGKEDVLMSTQIEEIKNCNCSALTESFTRINGIACPADWGWYTLVHVRLHHT